MNQIHTFCIYAYVQSIHKNIFFVYLNYLCVAGIYLRKKKFYSMQVCTYVHTYIRIFINSHIHTKTRKAQILFLDNI